MPPQNTKNQPAMKEEKLRVVRRLGGLEADLEGYGRTTRDKPFELPSEFALRLVKEGPMYELAPADVLAAKEV